MSQDEILARIAEIQKEIEEDNCKVLRERILERQFHFEQSGRSWPFSFLINKLRRRWIVELNHIIEPILDNQKEINLRLLKEIEKLKKYHESQTDDSVSSASQGEGPVGQPAK